MFHETTDSNVTSPILLDNSIFERSDILLHAGASYHNRINPILCSKYLGCNVIPLVFGPGVNVYNINTVISHVIVLFLFNEIEVNVENGLAYDSSDNN